MDTYGDLKSAVQSDLTVDDTSSFITPTTIGLAINRAYYRAGGMHKWPQLEDAKKTSTKNGNEYYDYPSNWYPQSVWKLTIDDQDYGDPLLFKDYLYEKDNQLPSNLKYMWASEWQRFFVYPIPTVNGNNNISVWGSKSVTKLVDDSDTTIFSYSMPECNDALVKEASHILKLKGQDMNETVVPRVGEMYNLDAMDILNKAWARIRMELMKREKTQPMFDVPDMFRSRFNNIKSKPGDF